MQENIYVEKSYFDIPFKKLENKAEIGRIWS